MDWSGKHEDDWKWWFGSGYILNTLPTGFVDGFDQRSDRKGEIKNKVFCLTNGMVLPFDDKEKTSEGTVCYPSGNIEWKIE